MVVTKSRKSKSLKSKKFRNKKTKKVGKMRGGAGRIDFSKTYSTIGRKGMGVPEEYAQRITNQALVQAKQTTFIPSSGMRRGMTKLVSGRNKMATDMSFIKVKP